MRIVSLSPACTEWVAAFGGLGELVGRSHACDVPPEVAELPVLTRPDSGAAPPRRFGSTEKWLGVFSGDTAGRYYVSLTRLVDLKPELILARLRPETCTELEAQLSGGKRLSPPARVVSMQADTLKQVLSGALHLGRAIGRTAASMQVVAGYEMRLKMLRDRIGLGRTFEASRAPSVALLERLDPPAVTAGWTGDVIEMAGGRPVCLRSGIRSEPLGWEALRSEDPDVLALALGCTDLDGARRSIDGLTRRSEWEELAAVRAGRVFLFDGSAYFNRPGPRLYRSIELMAAALFGARAGVSAGPREMAHLPS